jgi:hypothetical protein
MRAHPVVIIIIIIIIIVALIGWSVWLWGWW